jgi:uncharacterized membrane protein
MRLMTKQHARPFRSIAKSFSWRILATLTTISLVWIGTGKIDTALAIGGAEFIIKMVVYYGHERAWAHIRWGLEKYD